MQGQNYQKLKALHNQIKITDDVKMARPPSQGPLPAGAQNAIKKNVMEPKKQQRYVLLAKLDRTNLSNKPSSIKLILIGIPIMVVSSYMLYKRRKY